MLAWAAEVPQLEASPSPAESGWLSAARQGAGRGARARASHSGSTDHGVTPARVPPPPSPTLTRAFLPPRAPRARTRVQGPRLRPLRRLQQRHLLQQPRRSRLPTRLLPPPRQKAEVRLTMTTTMTSTWMSWVWAPLTTRPRRRPPLLLPSRRRRHPRLPPLWRQQPPLLQGLPPPHPRHQVHSRPLPPPCPPRTRNRPARTATSPPPRPPPLAKARKLLPHRLRRARAPARSRRRLVQAPQATPSLPGQASAQPRDRPAASIS